MPDAAAPRLAARRLKSLLAGPYDFTLAAGECAVIGGPSGSGKSLFLRMIADLDPNEGEVALDGQSREAVSGPEWRRRVPYVQAEAGWWTDLVAEHVAPDRREAARALAAGFGLTDGQFDGPVARLSTGEKQRLALVRGLVLESRILLLDEPTSALDRSDALRVEAELKRRLAAGTALLIVSHDANQAKRLGATRYQMQDRKLTTGGTRRR
jgi:ABC-type iron transport system FetAB ATPase subunit